MFKHPIRDLIMLSAVGWYAKRTIARRGGAGKVWASITHASPFARSRATAARSRSR